MAIVAILLACLILIVALGWQSWRLQQANAEAATLVLRDYGLLAADEFGRRLSNALGYYGYTELIKDCSEEVVRLRNRPEYRGSEYQRLRDAEILASGYFWQDDENLLVATDVVSQELRAMIVNTRLQAPLPETAYQGLTHKPSGTQFVYRLTSGEDNSRTICGFVVDADGLTEFIQKTLDRAPLLPASLAEGKMGNELLFLELQNAANEPVFQANPRFDLYVTVTRPLPDDPKLGLDGYTIRVSLDSQSAPQLVIGGLPESRLPWLLAILIMTVLLLVTAIWMFRREQAVMDMREDFVSQVSHELRTPLTQIRMFAETLLLGRARSDDERKRSLEIIDREARRLSHLVENVLRVSKVSDAVEMNCQVQQLAPVLQDVCSSMRSTTNAATIDLRASEAVAANIDADALRQIVLNLLDNAVKYGPERQVIKVGLENSNGVSRISVEDEGPGIPEAERERVWDTFYRLDREKTAAISGTGIGLSVVRDLTHAMGGECWIESEARGARIIVEFPGVVSDG